MADLFEYTVNNSISKTVLVRVTVATPEVISPVLTEDEAKEYTKLSSATLYRARIDKKLRVIKTGTKKLYLISELDKFLKNCLET